MASRKRKPATWTVYFIRFGPDGPIKIGKTKVSVWSRLSGLQTSCPDELHLLGVMSGQDETMEGWLHLHFSHHWIRGEWFRPGADLLRYIVDHAHAPDIEPAVEVMADPALPLGPRGRWDRLPASTKRTTELLARAVLEIPRGEPISEEDLIRFNEAYRRIGSNGRLKPTDEGL